MLLVVNDTIWNNISRYISGNRCLLFVPPTCPDTSKSRQARAN